ncbi:hypothetical protein MHO82_23880 [Vibrio sp. Of7-15]|uniref:hypothetical protein n=1 Tax=Vibrio sp. Of7-15 TaxID=2724879 RepID=UPI001EF346F5|nr:hypothetical protein [Vibrio sp. Of7-15]MCG7499909.1 hypothetical protein [Vibrio sp. Of7-15]
MSKRQKGMVSLLVTSMLLIAVLLISMTSYKNSFYQIKRAQNEVLARQAHWLAEGGVECAFSELQLTGVSPIEPLFTNDCQDMDSQLTINFYEQGTSGKQFKVSSYVDTAHAVTSVSKSVNYSGGMTSTIKMNASILELTGSHHFVPNHNGGQCQSIMMSGIVTYVSSSGSDEHFLTADSTTATHASTSPSFTCHPTYRSNLFDLSNPPTYLAAMTAPVKGEDIKEAQSINVFADLYGKSYLVPSEVDSVRTSFAMDTNGDVIGPKVVNGKGGDEITAHGWVKGCSELIENAVTAGKTRIWVDGSCAIGGSVFGTGITSDSSSAIELIIFNGFLEMNAVGYFNGLVYVYSSETLDAQMVWEDRVDNIAVPTRAFNKSDITASYLNVNFFVYDSLYLDGGIGIDAPGRTVKINGSIVPSYNSDKANKNLSKVDWVEGSWNDL